MRYQLSNHSNVLFVEDLTWAYYWCVLSNESCLLTGFWTGIQKTHHRITMMCFLRAAMGVRSSGSFLQAALLNCLAPIRDNCITYSDNLVLHGAQQEGLELLDKCFKLLISRRDTFLQVMSAAQACYSASHREIPGLTLALKSSENIIAGASITCLPTAKA